MSINAINTRPPQHTKPQAPAFKANYEAVFVHATDAFFAEGGKLAQGIAGLQKGHVRAEVGEDAVKFSVSHPDKRHGKGTTFHIARGTGTRTPNEEQTVREKLLERLHNILKGF